VGNWGRIGVRKIAGGHRAKEEDKAGQGGSRKDGAVVVAEGGAESGKVSPHCSLTGKPQAALLPHLARFRVQKDFKESLWSQWFDLEGR
jgi:hypothetical protein